MQHIIETIKSIIARLQNRPELAAELGDDANLIDDIGLDSLAVLQFMLELEERLDIRIDFNLLEFEHLASISTLAAALAKMPRRQTDAEFDS